MLDPKGIFPRVGIHLTVLLDGAAQEFGSMSLVPLESPALYLGHCFSEPWQWRSKRRSWGYPTLWWLAIPNKQYIYIYFFHIHVNIICVNIFIYAYKCICMYLYLYIYIYLTGYGDFCNSETF